MKNYYIWLFIAFATLFSGCKEKYSPKPKGYYRIDFPVKEYVSYQGNCAFRFEHPKRSIIDTKSKSLREKCWFNLHYPQYNCTIHLSYFDIQGDTLYNFIEEARTLAMKHIVKANQIKETEIANDQKNVYGVIYDFEGETATNLQFFLTDNSNHFIRGAMYYNLVPQPDSLEPVTSYIKADLHHFIESFSWR